MDKVFAALAVSVDGFITGRDPGPGRGLGDGGILFDWYGSGDVPSRVFGGFKLFEPSREIFDGVAARVGAVVARREHLRRLRGLRRVGQPTPDGSAHRGQPPSAAARIDG